MRKLIVSGLVVLALGATGARAATVTLNPLDSSGIGVGEMFTVELVGTLFDAATESTVGGGTNVSFDPNILRFDSANFDKPPEDDDPDWSTGRTLDVSPGSVDVLVGLVGGTVSGDFLIATLSFEALAVGLTPLDLERSNFPAGPWLTEDGDEIAVTFVDGSVFVPLPAAVWLFLTGIGALGVFGRRRRS